MEEIYNDISSNLKISEEVFNKIYADKTINTQTKFLRDRDNFYLNMISNIIARISSESDNTCVAVYLDYEVSNGKKKL